VLPRITETTALGAAYIAGLGAGLWRDLDALRGLWQAEKTWQPNMTAELRCSMVG
jgi:glycerol kinase